MTAAEPSMNATLSEVLAGFPIVLSVRVHWGDMDAFGHVNNVVFFRWFESARIEYLLRIDAESTMRGGGVGPILASIKCDYLQQVIFPDTVHIGTRVSRMGRSSMDIDHAVYSEARQGLAARGHSTVVLFDYDKQKAVRIPETIRSGIERLQPGTE